MQNCVFSIGKNSKKFHWLICHLRCPSFVKIQTMLPPNSKEQHHEEISTVEMFWISEKRQVIRQTVHLTQQSDDLLLCCSNSSCSVSQSLQKNATMRSHDSAHNQLKSFSHSHICSKHQKAWSDKKKKLTR